MRLFEGTEFDIPPRCDRCEELEADCECRPLPDPEPARVPPASQNPKVRVEKRKYGKFVTCVSGLEERDAAEVLVKLKNALGTGGTLKSATIELQGDHLERTHDTLKSLGFRVSKK